MFPYTLIQTYQSNGFPTFNPMKHLNPYQSFPCFYLAPEVVKVEEVRLETLHGDNWAFDSVETRGNYPRIHKLESILKGLTEEPSPLPPIDVFCIYGNYILTEGNHRYYASMMMGMKTILAKVCYYDYEHLIRNVTFKVYPFGESAIYNGQEEYLSKKEIGIMKELQIAINKK